MDHFGEQPRFETEPVIEQKPFENPAVQSFFAKWCEINDSIQSQIIDRDDWEQRGVKGILEKRPDGKQSLYIPKDLQLWEMVGVMEVVDHDTFAAKPERQDEAKKKLLELGKTFQNAGVCIAQRLGSIEQGQEIARALAEEFHGYGRSLIGGEKSGESESIDNIASHTLTGSEIETVDRFLAGDSLYESRRARAEKAAASKPDRKEEFYETERRKTLAQFFRASAKAFELNKPKKESTAFAIKNVFKQKMDLITGAERKTQQEIERPKSEAWGKYQKFFGRNILTSDEQTEKEKLENIIFTKKPWKLSFSAHSAFLTKIERALAQKIETPKRELVGSIFRRGMELLERNMSFNRLPNYIEDNHLRWQDGENTLREALQIEQLKSELETVRQSGNTTRISVKEREITDKIQEAVSSFPYQSGANKPPEMVANQYINCVGASMLGGALVREAGLNYLVGHVPKHSILFLVTSDDHVEWRDMLNSSHNEDLTDEMIDRRKKDGSPLTVADIVAFSKNPTPEGLMFNITSEKYRDKLHWVKKGQRQYLAVFEPEYGQQIQVLNSTGNALSALGRKKEAIEAYRQAIAVDAKYSYPYTGLGDELSDLGRKKEAIEAYCQAIAVDAKSAAPYNGLGNTLSDLGRKEEAIEAYRKFIELADKQKNNYWIKRAEKMITKLKK